MERLYEEFGKLLRRARKQTRMNQETLAMQVGLTRTSISNLEAGRQRLPLHLVYRFADVLNVEVNDLIPRPQAAEDGLDGLLNEVDDLRRDWVRRVISKLEQGELEEATKGVSHD